MKREKSKNFQLYYTVVATEKVGRNKKAKTRVFFIINGLRMVPIYWLASC